MGFWSNIGNFIKDNAVKIVATTAVAIATGGASLAIQAVAIGGAFVVGTIIDADQQQREQENKKLALAGEAGKAIQTQVNGLQDQRNQVVKEAEESAKELQRWKGKLNDPNASKEDKEMAKKMIPIIQNQLDEKARKVSDYDRKIEDLLKNIPDGTDKGGGIKVDPQTKLIIGAIIFLVIYFTLIKEKDR